MNSRECSWFTTILHPMAVPISNLREESKGENEGPSASFFCSSRRTTRSQSPQKDRKSAPLQVPPDETNSQETRSHDYTTSRNRNRSLVGRSGSSGTSKPSEAKASPRQSILITQTDTRSKHEFGDASGILSLGNRNLVDLALMANFEVSERSVLVDSDHDHG